MTYILNWENATLGMVRDICAETCSQAEFDGDAKVIVFTPNVTVSKLRGC